MSDVLPPGSQHPKESEREAKPPRRLMRVLGFLLVGLSVLLAWYLAIFYLGWQSGQSFLVEKQELEAEQQVERQISLAREDIENHRYALAIRRLEWVLEHAPERIDAQTLLAEAQAQLDTVLTPPVMPTPSPAPTSIPSPTPTAAPIQDPENELQRIQLLVEDEAWGEAVSSLIAFQWQHPSFERLTSDGLLYEAYIGLGLQHVTGAQVELGLTYLEQAESLGDLPPEVTDYRIWAELYLQGIAFYDVNWAATTYYFRDLCLAAPFYQSSCDRLFEALIAYGDQYAVAQDWCPALLLYEEAARHDRTQGLASKLDQAGEECLLATPTPMPEDPESLPITGTLPLTNTYIIPTPLWPNPGP